MKARKNIQWFKFGIITLAYLLFLIWIKSWWGLIVVPFIFDIYITKKINWTWWRNSKNPLVRTVMSWVDAIVFALIAVYFVNIYIFQNYQIPTSSLEKSLLVGDYLFVSKMSYGPRVPNTPLSMPLAQHTLPILNCKSYIEWPQWNYKRVKGLGKIKQNDIVVFNFPAGDTIVTKYQQNDFYSLAYAIGKQIYRRPINFDSLSIEQQREVFNLYYNAGRKEIINNPQEFGKVIYRPVDRRENYVKRCVGLPGDTLSIVNRQVTINGKALENAEDLQYNYYVQTTGEYIPESYFRKLGISRDDQTRINANSAPAQYISKGLTAKSGDNQLNPIYYLPLTHKMYQQLLNNKRLIANIQIDHNDSTEGLYPLSINNHWSCDNYGPIWIPSKKSTINLTLENLPIYERCIKAYEGNELEVKEGEIYINGIQTNHYTFKYDYYWMMGDNRHNSFDSRYWGFVPEDHIVGKPLMIWLSLDKDRNWFDGKIRWNRLFTWVK